MGTPRTHLVIAALACGLLALPVSSASAVSFDPLPKRIKTPIGTGGAVVKLGARGVSFWRDSKYKATSQSITAKRGGVTRRGEDRVTLGPGTWKVTRTLTYQLRETSEFREAEIAPLPGQCSITGFEYARGQTQSYDWIDTIGINCQVNGATLSGTYDVPSTIADQYVYMSSAPVGGDLVTVLADPTNFRQYFHTGGITDVGTITVSANLPVPADRVGPFSIKRSELVQVVRFNPGCITSQEAAQLRIGMRKSEATRIIGGMGTLVARGSGVEVRDYSGCSWSAIDGVAIRYTGGRVDVYSITRPS